MPKNVTFFDVVSAMRDRRVMRFVISNTVPPSDFTGKIAGIKDASRPGIYPQAWELTLVDPSAPLVSWHETNIGITVISETSPP